MSLNLTRREALAAGVGGAVAVAARDVAAADKPAPAVRMGITAAAYGPRWRSGTSDGTLTALNDALGFLEHCHKLGGGGIQTGVGDWARDFVRKLRGTAENYEMYLEGQIGLPRDERDADRFDRQVRAAREAGMTILRAVCLSGRRYETFDKAESFRAFSQRSERSLALAEPIVKKHQVRLAIENHKDWRVAELLGLLKRLSSEHVGVCLDTGNSIALLEDAMEVVRDYAALAPTTHFKDMAVRERDDGFLLSEVPLGEGFLDLARIVEICRKANPAVRFNLEMMTRDPLVVPCLGEKYWATMEGVPGRDLARTLATVRKTAGRKPLPKVSGLSPDERLRAEEDNIVACFKYAKEKLGL